MSISTISWVEVFSRHVSLIEDHLRFIEVAVEYATPDSDAWRTVNTLMERTQIILQESRQARQAIAADNLVGISAHDLPSFPHRTPLTGCICGGLYRSKNPKRDGDRGNQQEVSPRPLKRRRSSPEDQPQAQPENSMKRIAEPEPTLLSKRAKKFREEDVALKTPQIEYENIDDLVDARLREKAQRREHKNRKRKHNSEGAASSIIAGFGPNGSNGSSLEDDEPWRKKRKMSNPFR